MMAVIPQSIWSDALKESTLVVEVRMPAMPKLLRFRIWLGVKMIKLATIIMGCGVEIVEK